MQEMCSLVEKNSKKLETLVQAIGNLNLTDLAVQLVTVSQNLVENKQKLEEIKSAQLANTLVLKQVIKAIKAIPEHKETDMFETNKLLKELIAESKKPLKTTLKII